MKQKKYIEISMKIRGDILDKKGLIVGYGGYGNGSLNKIRKLYESMTLEELTEHLKSIGIEFTNNPDYKEGDIFESED